MEAVSDEWIKEVVENRWPLIDVYLSDFHIYSRDLGAAISKQPKELIAHAENDVQAAKVELKKEIEFALMIAFQEGAKAGALSERSRHEQKQAGMFSRAKRLLRLQGGSA